MFHNKTRLSAFLAFAMSAQVVLAACGGSMGSPAPASDAGDYAAQESYAVESVAAPAPESQYEQGEGTNINDAAYDMTFFENYGVNPFVDTEDDNLSTFAMDVDTGSYTVARRFLTDGNMPDPASVRVEEFVNYFNHDYAPPTEGAFAIHMEAAPSPFGNENHTLLRVGLQGKEIDASERKPASLVFVVDVSGSMSGERLEMVKDSLRLLVDELQPTDQVGIVAYGSSAFTVLQPTNADQKEVIMNGINGLYTNGSTNAEEGLLYGYQMAEGMMEQAQGDRIARLILCSDGVANVGRTGPDSILERVRQYVDQGITLSTVGVGMGNYNDVMMEQLANDGNGNYSYVDTLDEAERVFVENLTGMLQTIANDAKIQVDFNPDTVRSYRLLGYENRNVADDDFRNDDVDAGEVGVGHSVTALYELKLQEDIEATEDAVASESIATVFVRYENPETGAVEEESQTFALAALDENVQATTASFQLDAAVAEYAELLRESYWAQEGSFGELLTFAHRVESLYANDAEATEDVAEFVGLVEMAAELAEAQAGR